MLRQADSELGRGESLFLGWHEPLWTWSPDPSRPMPESLPIWVTRVLQLGMGRRLGPGGLAWELACPEAWLRRLWRPHRGSKLRIRCSASSHSYLTSNARGSCIALVLTMHELRTVPPDLIIYLITLYAGASDHTCPGLVLQLATWSKLHDTYPKLSRSPRCHLMVAVETGGRWGP